MSPEISRVHRSESSRQSIMRILSDCDPHRMLGVHLVASSSGIRAKCPICIPTVAATMSTALLLRCTLCQNRRHFPSLQKRRSSDWLYRVPSGRILAERPCPLSKSAILESGGLLAGRCGLTSNGSPQSDDPVRSGLCRSPGAQRLEHRRRATAGVNASRVGGGRCYSPSAAVP